MAVFAGVGDSTALFVVDQLEDVKRTLRPHLDLNRKIASIEFIRTRAQLLLPEAWGAA